MEKQGTVLMHRYELGRYLGHGTFAKVYQARNILTGEMVAMKIIDKERIERVGMTDQIKREIAVMRLIRHPNVVRLIEVMATRSKIYFAMEFVRGGELFCRVARGRLSEDEARRYFGQLVAAVDFCHSRGVYHRDLKPENLLLDEQGDLKVSDFGLSALVESQRKDGLLHTTCGTPAYVAPEVIGKKGYDGAKADIWSCGVILFVLLAGYLPFHDSSLIEMYRKISRGEFSYPKWFPADARKLLNRVLDPNPSTRISISKVIESPWLRRGFKLAKSVPDPLAPAPAEWEDIFAVAGEAATMRPTRLNAFDIISRSPGLDLSRLFETGKRKRVSSAFTTRETAAAVVSKLEEIAAAERFKVRKTEEGMVRLHGLTEGRKGKLAIEAKIFEVGPELLVVEMNKASGDTLEYQRFCSQGLRPSLKDIIWSWQGGSPHHSPPAPSPHHSPPAPEPHRPMMAAGLPPEPHRPMMAAGLPPLPPARRR